ncbi:AT-rich interactive domain-containing protein 5A isoform X1 [Megalops cyprinoides]|uniref:AT-rich interactive domain-containing protein 5A isoform X1 n=2 Tax=Megalops cyprinoides TaxID=118141 RepID=UPI001864CC35|nr:AT-rich interactive domain-containing protein 5A isoform X1 [Megalops cyprinoides]
MVSQPKSVQRKKPDQWEDSEVASAVDGEVPLNQQTCEMESSHPSDGGEDGSRASQSEAEEKSFVASLYTFMKDRGTPIERIPHLGFKQINLWRIYKAVEKLGGYDSVTARRLWKNVYDELGGSPGSTSAATCTRRHYERLVLPFERQLRGEEDKPLPPAKPRKQYKKSPEGKGSKAEGKKKKSHQEGEGEVHAETQEKPGEGSHCAILAESSQADCCGPNGEVTSAKDQTASNCAVTQPVKKLLSSVQSSGGEVISPLEKKKRMAQASLSLSQACPSPDRDSRGRPSVIHCAQSPGLSRSSRTRESSEGSPVPHSSSSSRSPSPCSVSSDDCLALTEDCAPAPGLDKPVPPTYLGNFSVSYSNGVCKPVSCYPAIKDSAGHLRHHRDIRQVNLFPTDPAGVKVQTPEWSPGCRGENRHASVKTHQPSSSSSADMGPKACWVPPMSSFTKVLPKSGEHLRPVSYQQGHKVHQSLKRPAPEDTSTYGKKLQMVPPLHHGESKERSKLGLPKPLPTQHSLYPHASFPISYFLPAYERTRPVSSHQLKGLSLPPLLFPAHLTQPSPVYRHVTSGTPYSVPYESFPRPRPYQIPLWHPQAAYAITGLNPHYPNTKL